MCEWSRAALMLMEIGQNNIVGQRMLVDQSGILKGEKKDSPNASSVSFLREEGEEEGRGGQDRSDGTYVLIESDASVRYFL